MIDGNTLCAIDGFVLVLDADQGLSPEAIELWNVAVDFSVPRCIMVTNIINSRTDFDEMCAIAQRVLDPDVIVRYLPIESDDESVVVGAFDVLTNEIVTSSADNLQRVPGDPEHLELTSDRRVDLYEALTHLLPDDQTFDQGTSGMPINVHHLSAAYLHDECVPIFFAEPVVLTDGFDSWVSHRLSRWEPIIESHGLSVPLEDVDSPVGVGIGTGMARMYGPSVTADVALQATGQTGDIQACNPELLGAGLIVDSRLTLGDSIATTHSGLVARLPEF